MTENKKTDIFDNNKIPIFVGSCGTIMNYIDEIKLLKKTNKYIFISSQSAYYFFEEYLGFYPDYHTFLDPTCYPFREFINKNPDELKCQLIIPKHIYTKYIESDFVLYGAGPHTHWDKSIWDNYVSFLKKNKDKIILIDSKIVKFNPSNFNENDDNCLCVNERYDKTFRHPCKLSMYIIPLIKYFNFQKTYIIGFDHVGGRFPSLNNNHDVPKSYGYNFTNEKISWNSFNIYIPPQIKNQNINIFNLVKNSDLNNYLIYKNIKELV